MDNTSDSGADAPAARFVTHLLTNLAQRNATTIRLERHPKLEPCLTDPDTGMSPDNLRSTHKPRGKDDAFVVNAEIDGVYQEVAAPPIMLWENVILRIKALASMVDYGPSKSQSGSFAIDIGGSQNVSFLVTSNPNPFEDNAVIIRVTPQ